MRLSPAGVTLGRGADCDVVLDGHRVSRRHARIFRDPFGRWIIEDLASHNGTLVAGQRIDAHALLGGEQILIGPFLLQLSHLDDRKIGPDPSVGSDTAIVKDSPSWRLADLQVGLPAGFSVNQLLELNRISDRLGDVVSSSQLYPELCECMAGGPECAALVLRLPNRGQTLPESPLVLAHVCRAGSGVRVEGSAHLHLSRRVLEAVRRTTALALASNTPATDEQMSLTVKSEDRPRAVCCVPISEITDTLDALYLDLPADVPSPEMVEFIRAVARQAALLRKGLLLGEARAERRVLDEQLSLAREIQQKLTPTPSADVAGLDVAICYQPALWVGGDYCDVWLLPDGRVAFAVGDVSGKGLPAAMVMSNLHAALRTTTSFCGDLAQVAGHVNQHLKDHVPVGMFVTLFLAAFDPATNSLEYVNAGHILPFLVRSRTGVSTLGKPSNPPLGVAENPFLQSTETLEPGTGLLVVSDGITEAVSSEGEQLGVERLEGAIRTSGFSSAGQLVQSAVDLVAGFCQSQPQRDDITILALVNLPKAASATTWSREPHGRDA